jgi:hypothetical protein
MFQIVLMNIRVMQKARETKSRNTRYQTKKYLLLKDYGITMNILEEYNTNRHSIVSFKAVLRELEKIKKF